MKKTCTFLMFLFTSLSMFSYPIVVQTVQPKKERVVVKKEFQMVLYPKLISVFSGNSGKVEKIYVKEGDFISKGTVIAILKNEYNTEKEKLVNELKKWKRILWKREHWKVRSKSAENQAKNRINDIKKKIDEIEEKLKKNKIRSPEDGYVQKINVKVNDEIESGFKVAEVVDYKKYEGFIDLKGEKVQLPFNKKLEVNWNDSKLVLTFIKEKEGKLLVTTPGLPEFNKLPIKLAVCLVSEVYEDALIISKDLIRKDEKGYFIFVLDKDKFLAIKKYIKYFEYKKRVVVTDGISKDDEIIKTGIDKLNDGDVVWVLKYDREMKKYILIKPSKRVEKAKRRREITKKKKSTKKAKERKKVVLKEKLYLEKIGVQTGADVFSINDKNFKDFYKIPKTISFVKLLVLTKFHFGISFNYREYKDTSSTSYYNREMNFDIITKSLDLFYYYNFKKLIYGYAGLSKNFYSFSEMIDSDLLEDIKDNASGTGITIGFFVNPSVLKDMVILGLEIRRNWCKKEINTYDFDLGGTEILVTFGIIL